MPKYLARNPEAKVARAAVPAMRTAMKLTEMSAPEPEVPMRRLVLCDFDSHDDLLATAMDPSRDSATSDDVDRAAADSIPGTRAVTVGTHADGVHGARCRHRSLTRTASETSVEIETDVGTPLA